VTACNEKEPAQPTPASACRDFNFAALVIGPPQCGKTTFVRGLVVDHLRRYPTGLAFVHDPNLQFRDICPAYEDVHAWRRAFDAATVSRTPISRGACVGGQWSDVRAMAVAIGRARNTAGNVRVPILLACDESSMIGDSGRSYVAQEELQLLSTRRHLGVGPVYNAQQATSLVDAFYALATDVIAFAQRSERETLKLEERCGLPEGALASLVGAARYHYVRIQAGRIV